MPEDTDIDDGAPVTEEDRKKLDFYGRMPERDWKYSVTKHMVVYHKEIGSVKEQVREVKEELAELREQVRKASTQAESNTQLLRQNFMISLEISEDLKAMRADAKAKI